MHGSPRPWLGKMFDKHFVIAFRITLENPHNAQMDKARQSLVFAVVQTSAFAISRDPV